MHELAFDLFSRYFPVYLWKVSWLGCIHGHIPENHSSNKITFFYYLIDI
jgi:hypothetical protein